MVEYKKRINRKIYRDTWCLYCDNHLFQPYKKKTDGEDCNDYCALTHEQVLSSADGCEYYIGD